MERTTLKFKQLIYAVLGIFIVSLLISGCSSEKNAKNSMRRISSGYYHSVAIKNDGTVWFWGEKLIHGKKDSNVLVPEKVKGINNAVQVSAGLGHTLVLKRDGTVWEFGGDKDGWIPTQVKGLSEVADISAGYDYYCLALKKDGTVWTWQYPSSTGISTGISLHKINELTGVKKVEAGEGVAAALKNDGTLWEWCEDVTKQAFKPTMVKGLRDIIDISLGSSIIAALKNDGTLFVAGEGFGVPLKVDSPIKKYDIKGIVGISAKACEWAALLKDGTVIKGGYSFEDNKNILKTPLLVPGINDAVGISDGGSRLLILKKDGSMAAMGSNFEGELGDGTMTGRRLPAKAAFNIDPNIIVKLKNVDPKKDLIYSVGDQKAKEMDQLSDKIIKMLDNRIDKTQYEVVKVSDAEQFIKNIKSNTDIVLDHGKNYELTGILDRSANNKNTLGESFTSKGLIIKAVDNLKIRSDGNELANIMVSPLYSNVIIFEDCNNITIENIRAGHEPKKLSTSGDVFVFRNCKNIKIMGSTLYSGDGGVSASGAEDMLFKNSIIEGCTYSLINMENSKNILFENSKLRNTSDVDFMNSDIINIKDSENVVFTNCDVTKNMASGKYGEHVLWNINNVLPMLIVRDTSISDNTAAYFRAKRDNMYFSNVKLLNNTFTKGSYATD